MEANRRYRIRAQGGVADSATLYLCRQRSTWVVVLEAPGSRGAVPLRPTTRDTYDARFELLETTRRACPDATVVSFDGVLEGADYEWRLDVRGFVTHTGDIGAALKRALTFDRPRRHGRPGHPGLSGDERRMSHRCRWGRCPEVSGRPLAF